MGQWFNRILQNHIFKLERLFRLVNSKRVFLTARTHGKGGPIRVALPEYTGMADIYCKAAEELGKSS
jgi:hypothetical protein